MLTLPDELAKGYPIPGEHYSPGSEYFVFRKPFLINMALRMASPKEQAKRISPKQSAFYKELAAREIGEKDVYVGIAGLKSLDFLTLAGREHTLPDGTPDPHYYQHAVLFDVNQRQVSAMKQILALIDDCPTREAFVSRFTKLYMEYMEPPKPGTDGEMPGNDYHTFRQLPPEEQKKYFNVFGANKGKYQPQDERSMESLQRFIMGRHRNHAEETEHSWLASDANYQVIRALVKKKEIQVATMDLRDSERVEALGTWLDEKKLRIGDLYISSTMSFMDPKFRGDYFGKNPSNKTKADAEEAAAKAASRGGKPLPPSKPSLKAMEESPDPSLQDAKQFYKDLLGLMDKNGHYIVSVPEADVAFMQDYHLESWDKAKMRRQGSQALSRMPEPHEKTFDSVFNAGDMVWRSLGFPCGRGGALYYRIFSEMPVSADRIGQLQEQVETINQAIAEVNSELLARSKREGKIYLPVQLNNDPNSGGYLHRLEDMPDHEFFQKQVRRAKQFKQMFTGESRAGETFDLKRKYNVMLSTIPFRVRVSEHGQDPAETLNILEEKITEALERKRTMHAEVKPQASMEGVPQPEVIVTEAARNMLKRQGANQRGAGNNGI